MISFTGHNRRLREKLKIERIIAKRNRREYLGKIAVSNTKGRKLMLLR